MANPRKPAAVTPPAASAAPAADDTDSKLQALKDELARLQAALADKDKQLEDARKGATSAQALAALQQREIEEMPTGKTVTVQKIKSWKRTGYNRENGQPIREPVWHEVQVPTYWYRIELPPSGGTGLKFNGEELMHGQTYELDLDMLRTVKDAVAKSWAHEQNIRGSNENFYRREKAPILRGGQARSH